VFQYPKFKVSTVWLKCYLVKRSLTLWCVLGVGKTSMVLRYVGKMFSNHISPTIGASFFTCKLTVEDTRVKLQVQLLPYSYVVLCLVYIYKFNFIMFLLQGLGYCWTGEVSFHGTNVLSECQCCTHSIWHYTVWYISGCERLGERYVLDGMIRWVIQKSCYPPGTFYAFINIIHSLYILQWKGEKKSSFMIAVGVESGLVLPLVDVFGHYIAVHL